MTLALGVLLFTHILILYINKKLRCTLYDAFFFVMSPYVVIILFNNVFMYKNGFERVTDRIILLHLFAMLIFYAGTIFGHNIGKKVKVKQSLKQYQFEDIQINTLKILAVICIVLVLGEMILRISQHGVGTLINENDGSQGSIAAHVTNLMVPIIILLFDNCCENKNKNKSSIILILLSMCLIFLSFVKYHIISTVLSIFIYIAIKRPKLIKKLGILAILFVCFLFVVNYIISFAIQDVSAESSFYFNHLWGYIVGGTLSIRPVSDYFNTCGVDLSLGLWILEMILGIPDMILSKMFNMVFVDYNFSLLVPRVSIGMGSANIVSILGAAYIQSNIWVSSLFFFLWGFLVQFVYVKVKTGRNLRTLLPASIFLSYNMLSFFASFFELTKPWETIILSYLIFTLLRRRINIKKNKVKS